ncbi:MAG: hypothetical protein QOH21_1752 [Acidobacteriota bacterium]|nr:hypothetical protein [Acidobacteriota bacterium]
MNTSNQPQIARATIWTDWAFAVMTFDIFLTGYDVQAINLYDVLVNGRLPGTGSVNSPAGSRSVAGNPRFLPSAQTSCAQMPSAISSALIQYVLNALRNGTYPECGNARAPCPSRAATAWPSTPPPSATAAVPRASPRTPSLSRSGRRPMRKSLLFLLAAGAFSAADQDLPSRIGRSRDGRRACTGSAEQ